MAGLRSRAVTEVVPARDEGPAIATEEEGVLDGIDALRVLRADTPEEKTRLLQEIAGSGKPEQDIVSQLSKIRPLYKPAEFEGAHRLVMRSLEVLDRNGARAAKLPPLGPLKPIAQFLVQLVTRWIVRNYQNDTVTAIRKLYERHARRTPFRGVDPRRAPRPRHRAAQRRSTSRAMEQGLN